MHKDVELCIRFAHHNNKRFEFWDATECIFPRFINGTTNTEQVFDLVHIRDVIQHLILDQGLKYFCNAFLSGVKVLVTTSHQLHQDDNAFCL